MRTNVMAVVLAAIGFSACAHNQAAPANTTEPAAQVTVPPAPRRQIVLNPNISRVQITDKGFAVTEKIQFNVNSAVLVPISDMVLGEVATLLKENAHLQVVEIEGHTSSEGAAARNKELSQQRADAVKAWLTEHGVAADRLVAKGYGSEKPVADDKTEMGREQNRRVDFTVIKETPADAPAAPDTAK